MTAWHAFTLTAIVLWLKMMAVVVIQGGARVRAGRYRRPEDARFFGRGKGKVDDAPLATLGQAALNNDLENIPMFLLLLVAWIELGATGSEIALHGSIFALARCLHTIAYMMPRQPLRNMAFSAGMFMTMSVVLHAAFDLTS